MPPILRYLLVFAAIIAVISGAAWLLDPEVPAESPVAPESSTAKLPAKRSTQAPSQLLGTVDKTRLPEQLPGSLQGTQAPSGWLKVDRDNRLMVTPALRGMFEYYLAALGEESLPQLVARIDRALEALPEPARSEANELLGQYLDYKLAVGELETRAGEAGSLQSAEQQLQAIRDLRREYLGEVAAEAFFAREEAIDRFQVRRREIMDNRSLSDAERKAQLAAAESELPESLQEARAESRKFMTYQARLEALQDDPNATEADISRLRESTFGAEIAQRLEDVEQAREDWQRRWAAYRSDLAALESAGLAEPERKAEVQRLRDQYFSEQEQVRVQALDSVN
ncbi:lipase secretion chaperone [Marinobacter nanhaiticus D15-8W]|uniref:Lipase chaperone n=1 Tax=Marinobacter nanhaiticus D15-8W TaxID=626887 RepID=N6WX57_9GAMM|nr:lipase secretion chaperone [Marinobacter nanhaiticus]ENO15647.1 lipase [Marinobacter nanhaiticus D15-8W]BES73502.1 lipase secretion chaperone [Marinobacter nanhaiticus D15-8W]